LVKDWLTEHGCDFEEADITKDVFQLREWRALTGGVGVPVVAHGKDFVIGFSPERLEMMLDCFEHTSPVDIPEEE
jgi:arsenate reductase-like glutaredoxin family protein